MTVDEKLNQLNYAVSLLLAIAAVQQEGTDIEKSVKQHLKTLGWAPK